MSIIINKLCNRNKSKCNLSSQNMRKINNSCQWTTWQDQLTRIKNSNFPWWVTWTQRWKTLMPAPMTKGKVVGPIWSPPRKTTMFYKTNKHRIIYKILLILIQFSMILRTFLIWNGNPISIERSVLPHLSSMLEVLRTEREWKNYSREAATSLFYLTFRTHG